MGTRDRDLLLVTSLRDKLKAGAAGGGGAAGAGYAGSRKGPRAEDVVKLFETIAQAPPRASSARDGTATEGTAA